MAAPQALPHKPRYTGMEQPEVFAINDRVNGQQLIRVTVTPTNVEDLSTSRTARAGTKYQIAPGRLCIAKKAVWGLQMQYENHVEELEKVAQEINAVKMGDYENPYHWMNILIKKAAILTNPEGFTWDEVSLKMEGADQLAVDVLQRIGNDFLFRTNANLKRQLTL